MTDIAVFADGPLKGETHEVLPSQRASGLMWRYTEWPALPLDSLTGIRLPGFETALYRFREFAVLGRVVLVGSVAQPPSDDDLFDVLLSEAARKSALARLPETGRSGSSL